MAVNDHRLLDYTPTPVTALNHDYRPRLLQKEIQPGMRFQGEHSPKGTEIAKSRSVVKLPSIGQAGANPEVRMHFKGVQEMGNKLKSTQTLM
jgi:hypothetical protein